MGILEEQEILYNKSWQEYKWSGEKLYPVLLPLTTILHNTPKFYEVHTQNIQQYNVRGSPRSGTKWIQRIVELITGAKVTHGHAGIIEDFNKPNHRVVFICRDVRDAIISVYYFIKQGKASGAMHTTTKLLNNMSEAEGIKQVMIMYMKYRMPYLVHLFNEKSKKIIKIRYEGLILDHIGCIQRLAKRLEYKLKPHKLKLILQETSFKKLSKGRIPGKEDRNHHYRKGIIGDWKNHFNDNHLKIFDQMGGNDLLKDLGYPV